MKNIGFIIQCITLGHSAMFMDVYFHGHQETLITISWTMSSIQNLMKFYLNGNKYYNSETDTFSLYLIFVLSDYGI